jgi:folate-binding protein YgfZ
MGIRKSARIHLIRPRNRWKNRIMPTDWRTLDLERWAVLRIAGPDAVRFLQGQLSNDVALLNAERSLLAGFHNPQGRVIAILRLLQWAPEEVLALLPRELVSSVIERLRRFVLRAKVRLTDATPEWRVLGLIGTDDTPPHGLRLPLGAGAQLHGDGQLCVRVSDAPSRCVLLTAAGNDPLPDCAPADPREWTRLDVAAGMPQVYAQTSELFVAQMLNLDLIEAISFSKGCYTGQEVIARAHYRGRVKRRMQRWRTSESALLAPGDAAKLADGRSLRIVEAAVLEDGRCDFLAVAGPVPAPDASESVIGTEAMPLPYALPAD